jgi:hypothetical protein
MDELLQSPSGGAPVASGTVQSEASIAASSWGGLQLSDSQLGALGRSSQTQEVARPSKTGDAVFQTEQTKPVQAAQTQPPPSDFQPAMQSSAQETDSSDLR